jgi:anti-anti-sigma factor
MITTRATAHIVVDLTGVDFCDTAAVRALTRLAETATGHGTTFRLRGARVHIAWLCDQLGAGHLMSPTPSR